MIRAREIQKGSNTFFILKAFNKYICYETCFGNPIRIKGQIAYGRINRISSIIPYLKRRDGTKTFKLFYYEPDLLEGYKEKPLPNILRGRKRTVYEFKESSPKLVDLNYNPWYDIIVRGPRFYYCIEVNGEFLLYDDDFGNPIKADLTDKHGNTFVIKSRSQNNTMKIINSLPEGSTVYSFKITNNGIERGQDEMRRFDSAIVKKTLEKTKVEKLTDGTRSLFIKKDLQQKKIEQLTKA